MSLFPITPNPENRNDATRPLAERMRPRTLDEFTGQDHLFASGRSLRVAIERDDPGSLLFWGPPGVGKTTLAKIIAASTKSTFIEFSAVLSGIAEIKKVMQEAERARSAGIRTILFIDEIHRFNKAQQDAFLPHVERGNIRLIGATTENPSFEVNAALLSRCRVFTLLPLTPEQIIGLLRGALVDTERGLGRLKLEIADDALDTIAMYSNGDARAALNILEAAAMTIAESDAKHISREIVSDAMQRKLLRYDKQGEEHYNLISALHKSVRNSDSDASLYWLARMLESGEDPMYLARRIVRMAIEDIGLASPQALNITLAARDAMHFLGRPEGDLALAQAVVYMALAPKSNSVYMAFGEAMQDVNKTSSDPVPLHLRNAPTRLMKSIGYGTGYKYAHDFEEKVTDMQCLPDNLKDRQYYQPTNEGYENELRKRWDEIKAKLNR